MNLPVENVAREPGSGTWLSRLRIISACLIIAALLVYIGYFVVLLAYGQAVIRFPFDYDQGEGFELYDAIRLARGEHIYLDNTSFPFYSSNYPPVFRLMLTPLVLVFGSHLWVGRVMAFACALLIGLLIVFAARKQLSIWSFAKDGVQRWLNWRNIVAAVAGLAFFAANYVYQIAPLARAHLPMVMFAFAGVYCLDNAFRVTSDGVSNVKRNTAIAGVVLLIIAGFTKLQAIDAMVAGFVFLLMRKPRWFVISLALSVFVTGVVVVVLNVWTHGQFWFNVVTANVNEYDIQQTWFVYSQWFQLQGVLILCSIGYVVWDVARAIRQRSIQPITIWSLYFVAGAAMGLLTGKWGAGPTYLIAAIAASCVCMVGLADRVARLIASHWYTELNRVTHLATSILVTLSAIVLLAQATRNVHMPTSGRLFGGISRLIGVNGVSSYPPYQYFDSIGYTQLGHLLDSADTQNGWELVRIVRDAKGPVWSEEAMLTLLAGKDVVTNPTQLLNLSKGGLLDTSHMIEMIDNKAFGAVVFRAQFYPQDVLIAIGRNYHWVNAVRMNGFDYQVLMPNEVNNGK